MPIFEIRLSCRGCDKECRATISDATRSAKIRCSACGITLLEARSITGYVYVFSHPKLRGLLKVGFTRRLVAQELQELSWVSGLPDRFVLEGAFESSAPEQHVAEIHTRLASRRVQGMEYFEVTVPVALKVARDVIPPGPLDETRGPASSQPEVGEASSGALGQWSCGLCKHEWRAGIADRCPLCQSSAVVLLAGSTPSLDTPTA